MVIYLMAEPAFLRTSWARNYRIGIRREATETRTELVEGTPPQEGSPASVVILLGSSEWVEREGMRYKTNGGRVVVLRPCRNELSLFSCVEGNFPRMAMRLFGYCERHGRRRIALFGANRQAYGDVGIEKLFLQRYPQGEVFPNEGDLDACCARFSPVAHRFEAVVCCNEFAALRLALYLRREAVVDVPGDLWILAVGNSVLCETIEPSITTICCDGVAVGRKAVRLGLLLARNPDLSAVTQTIEATLVPRASTGFAPETEGQVPLSPLASGEGRNRFGADGAVRALMAIDNLIEHTDPLDRRLLGGMLDGKPYAQLAEEHGISENTVKYRMKRMHTHAGVGSKKQFVDLLRTCFDQRSFKEG